MRRLTVLLPLLFLMLCASAQAKPELGIADQKAEALDDPRLRALNLSYGRLYLPWDVLKEPNSLRETDAWLKNAKRDGLEPMLTIARSRIVGREGVRPTPKALAAEVVKWRKRWPGQVKLLSTWNEANLGYSPELVASWWLAVRRACPGCTVLGADLLDEPKVLAWTARFVKAAKRSPAIWGIHAYNDANTFSTKVTKALLKGLKGEFWLTETGGVATRSKPIYAFTGCGVAHQTKATRFLLETIAKLSPRIKRIYIFNWNLGQRRVTFDASLIDAADRERPALNVVRKYLGQAPVLSPPGGVSRELSSCKKGTVKVKTPKKAKKAKKR